MTLPACVTVTSDITFVGLTYVLSLFVTPPLVATTDTSVIKRPFFEGVNAAVPSMVSSSVSEA